MALLRYETKEGDVSEWAIRTAMLTIESASKDKVKSTEPSRQPDPEGRVTWLVPLSEEGKPLVADVANPFGKVPGSLEGKDWTKYDGYLHTDHAVREEFFQDRDVPPTIQSPYIMDFTYIYDNRQPDFKEFTEGLRFSDEQVFAEIGSPESRTHRDDQKTRKTRSPEQDVQVAQQLHASLTSPTSVPDIDFDA
jgi:hypothetical protein